MAPKKPQVEVVDLDNLLPDDCNLNKHKQDAKKFVENSIARRGAFRGIAAAGKGTDKPVVKAGNLTLEKAKAAGIKGAILVHTDGSQLVVTVRDDLDPNSPQAIMLGLEDNQTAHLSYDIDPEMLAAFTQGEHAILAEISGSDEICMELLDQMFAEFMPPDFSPGSPDEQGQLDQKKMVTCPNCGHEFAPSEK